MSVLFSRIDSDCSLLCGNRSSDTFGHELPVDFCLRVLYEDVPFGKSLDALGFCFLNCKNLLSYFIDVGFDIYVPLNGHSGGDSSNSRFSVCFDKSSLLFDPFANNESSKLMLVQYFSLFSNLFSLLERLSAIHFNLNKFCLSFQNILESLSSFSGQGLVLLFFPGCSSVLHSYHVDTVLLHMKCLCVLFSWISNLLLTRGGVSYDDFTPVMKFCSTFVKYSMVIDN